MKLKIEKKSKFHHNYSDEVKKFALTLLFYSPRAYKFIRKRCILPHPSRLHKYLSSKKCEPGVLTEVLDFLKDKILKGDDVSHLKNVALIFDAMAIRETRVYDPKLDKNVGYVNLGGIANDDSEQLATEALFLQIVSFTKPFKCPVAYFLINKVNAHMQAQIIKCIIDQLYNIGITVRSLTCDGI